MRLIHYSRTPLTHVDSVPHDETAWTAYKPCGLWFSVEGERDWLEWCKSQEFNLECLACATEIILVDDHQVLHINSVEALDKFSAEFGKDNAEFRHRTIDWLAVRKRWRGIIIAPYIWQRRLDIGEHGNFWYYGWDCASGVIWDAAAIKELRALDPPDLSVKAA